MIAAASFQTWAFMVIMASIGLWVCATKRHRDVQRDRAATHWRRLVVDATEPSHVTVYTYPPPSYAYDWARERDLRVPMPIQERGKHAAA